MARPGLAQKHIRTKKKPTKIFDKLVYFAGLVTVLLTLPQIKNIWIDKKYGRTYVRKEVPKVLKNQYFYLGSNYDVC